MSLDSKNRLKTLVNVLLKYRRNAESLIFMVLTIFVLYFAETTSLGAWIDASFVQRIEFKVRHMLNRDPILDPRIRIYMIDDSTIKKLQRSDVAFGEWRAIFNGMAGAKPSHIMIDKIFGTPDLGDGNAGDSHHRGAGTSNLVALAYAVEHPLRTRPPLPADSPLFQIGSTQSLNPTMSWVSSTIHYAYGPDVRIINEFSKVGHALYSADGFVEPILRLEGDKFLVHWAFSAAKSLELNRDGMQIDGEFLKMRSSRLLVNLVSPDKITDAAFGMDGAYFRMKAGRSFSEVIKEGQIVIILPAAFTGGTDFVPSAFGMLPGGYIMVSMVNSVLTKKWVNYFPPSFLIDAILMSSIGALCLWGKKTIVFLFLILFPIASPVVGIGVFSYLGIKCSWFMPSLVCYFSGIMIFKYRLIYQSIQLENMRDALRNIVGTTQAQKLIALPQAAWLSPSTETVSIIFIDIVGFSLSSERFNPQEIFTQLKDLLEAITHTVHKFDGVIDKTLGDGLLCFFGYDLLGSRSMDHATVAVQCALEIQKENYDRCFASFSRGIGVFPLRIGVNTGKVHIGNIGNQYRFDFTMIGDGVNFASRLENSCDPFKILVGSSTYNSVEKSVYEEDLFVKKYIKIKHHAELIEAYQVDPFCDAPEKLEAVEKLYWNYAKVRRKEERTIISQYRIELASSVGSFRAVDLSFNGFGVTGDLFLARGVTLDVKLKSPDHALERDLKNYGLQQISLEVKWSKREGRVFFHGTKTAGLNDEQRHIFHKILLEYLQSRDSV